MCAMTVPPPHAQNTIAVMAEQCLLVFSYFISHIICSHVTFTNMKKDFHLFIYLFIFVVMTVMNCPRTGHHMSVSLVVMCSIPSLFFFESHLSLPPSLSISSPPTLCEIIVTIVTQQIGLEIIVVVGAMATHICLCFILLLL